MHNDTAPTNLLVVPLEEASAHGQAQRLEGGQVHGQAHGQAHRQAHGQALVEQVLEVFAREARVDRAVLQLDARADALGVSSLDLTLALFELEDHFDIQLPDLMGGSSAQPTVGDLVQQVLDAIQRRDLAAARS